MTHASKALGWQFAAVFLVALNMRMTISGVGPLLDDIAESRGVGAATLGLLASIPLLTWAIVSPLAHGVGARLGMDRTITWSLAALLIGTVWRSLSASPANLWLGTALIGIGLAVANVLMPAIIKRDFGPRTPAVMGVYSAALGGAAAIGTAIAIPVARFEVSGTQLEWEAGLLASGFIIPFALVAWIIVTHTPAHARNAPDSEPPAAPGLGRRVWRSPTAWLLAAYMGTQSMSFYILATWVAPIVLSRGASEVGSGVGITLFHVFGMLGSLLAPVALRRDGRSLVQISIPIMLGVAMVGIVFAPPLSLVWIPLLGLGCGSGLSVALTLIAQRSGDVAVASAVSGMSQAVGYLIAAAGPVLFGWAFDLTGDWILPLAVALLGMAGQFVSGWILRDGRIVRA